MTSTKLFQRFMCVCVAEIRNINISFRNATVFLAGFCLPGRYEDGQTGQHLPGGVYDPGQCTSVQVMFRHTILPDWAANPCHGQ